MNKCYDCGFKGKCVETPKDHLLDGVAVVAAVEITCPKCGATSLAFDQMEAMYREVALALASKPERMSPGELRWMRKYLGFSGADWAEYLGVARETVSGWENRGKIPEATEKLLRMMVKVGPHIEDYGAPATLKPMSKRKSLPRFNLNSAGRWCRV